MKIKLIDLLVKKANKEEMPKKIKCQSGLIFTFNEETKDYAGLCEGREISLQDYYNLYNILNITVEILEPKKTEKIQIYNREDSKTFQYSVIPGFMSLKEVIRICNENFERHQEIIYILVNTLNKTLDNLNYLLEKSRDNER